MSLFVSIFYPHHRVYEIRSVSKHGRQLILKKMYLFCCKCGKYTDLDYSVYHRIIVEWLYKGVHVIKVSEFRNLLMDTTNSPHTKDVVICMEI